MGFDPSVIHPAVGDVIAFEFRSGDHSVVRECSLVSSDLTDGLMFVERIDVRKPLHWERRVQLWCADRQSAFWNERILCSWFCSMYRLLTASQSTPQVCPRSDSSSMIPSPSGKQRFVPILDLPNKLSHHRFFDEAGGLCHKGAVLAANPTLTQSAAAFVENAAKAPIAPPPSASSTGSDSSTEGSTPTGSTDLPAPTTNSAIKDNAHFSALGFVFAIVMGFL